MKTRKAFEIEIQRNDVTPAQFLAYLRSMQKKHPAMSNDFNLNYFKGESWSSEYSNALPTERPCESEIITDKPYTKQTYIRNHDGSTYNEIIEFQFNDDVTGYGYYYTVQIDVADEDREANTAENIAAIIRRRAEQAERQEAQAEKAEQEVNDANPAYAASWWIDSKRHEAARLRREAAETRAAIKATQEAQEAPQEAPAAEAEQQPTETENAPQAATQAAEGTAQQADPITAAILGAIGATAPAHTVTVTWANGSRATYSADLLDMLRTDPAALDIQDDGTGELIYISPAVELAAMEAEQAAPAADPDAATLAPADAAQVWTEDGETVATTTEAATVAGIIRRKGGYRERDLLTHPHEMTHGETWNEFHKVVNVLAITPDPDGYRAGCAVDIVTRSIVG